MERINSADFLSRGYEVEPAALHSPVSKVARLKSNVQGQLHRDPVKWAGIAAATGLGIGFLGRYLRYRAKVRKRPQLYVIEGC
jgi:hypothetical protein